MPLDFALLLTHTVQAQHKRNDLFFLYFAKNFVHARVTGSVLLFNSVIPLQLYRTQSTCWYSTAGKMREAPCYARKKGKKEGQILSEKKLHYKISWIVNCTGCSCGFLTTESQAVIWKSCSDWSAAKCNFFCHFCLHCNLFLLIPGKGPRGEQHWENQGEHKGLRVYQSRRETVKHGGKHFSFSRHH